MPRRLYNIAVVTSLVLFVVVMGLWVVSGLYVVIFPLNKVVGSEWFCIAQGNGVIGIGWFNDGSPPPMIERFILEKLDRFSMIPPDIGQTVWFGLGYVRSNTQSLVFIPHWLLAILALILPAAWLDRRRRKREPDAVPCAKCGYDLRGSPGGACPECGAGVG